MRPIGPGPAGTIRLPPAATAEMLALLPLRPPDLGRRLRELRIGRAAVRLPFAARRLLTLRSVDPQPVLVVPGYGMVDLAFAPLRYYLSVLGHQVHGSGLGLVHNDVDAMLGRLTERARLMAEAAQQPVTIVGHSLGGLLARETARDAPGSVSQVITLGTPVEGGPAYTALARSWSRMRTDHYHQTERERLQVPLHVPVTAVWSDNDGVVSPAACHDRRNRHVEHVEVTSTHFEMGLDPDVWEIIARRLSATTLDNARRRKASQDR